MAGGQSPVLLASITLVQGVQIGLFPVQVKERASKAEPTVKQVKILRDADKTGEAKAKSAKSKGFAFVELTEHEHALCVLRQLNNNPVPFGVRSLRIGLTTCKASMATI